MRWEGYMPNINRAKRNNSVLAFLAAAFFWLAGIGEVYLGVVSRRSFFWLAVAFLISAVLWTMIGFKFRKSERG